MPHFSLCRVCLASDVTVYNILNSCLQEMYEKLTRLPLHADDGKPHTVCGLCLSLLRNTYTLWVKSVTADRLLTRLLARGNELSLDSIKQINRKEHKLSVVLTIAPQHHVDIKSEEYEVPVKVESEEVKVEYQGFSDADTRVSNKDDSQTDSEDDVPLQTISEQNKLSAEKKGAKDEAFLKGFKSGYARELLLSKEQQLEELKERAASVNYLNAPFKCELCCRGFIEAGAFRNHREKHDPKSGAHVCDVCSMRYSTPRKLRAHAVTAHERRYQCLSCEHRTHTASQAREHERRHRGHVYRCALCGHGARAATSLLTHVRAQHRSRHVCARCGRSFVGAHGLRMHAAKAHARHQPSEDSPPEERYCLECDIQFETLLAWKRHILGSVNHAFGKGNNGVCAICGPACPGGGAHLKESVKALRPATRAPALRTTSLACEQCGSSFATSSKLQAHVKRVHLGLKYNKNVVCEVCGKKCTSNASLKYHQRTHTGEKPHKCETCDKRFADSNQLRIHTRRHTGERPYCCRHCRRSFTQKPALNRHYRGEKPHKCKTCDKRFADSNQLRIHTRRHTGERPYCCRHCRRSFTQKPALNRHYRVHTGAKPYSCQYCAKNFSQSNSLKLHVRTVHLKLPNNKKRNAQEVEKKEEKIE